MVHKSVNHGKMLSFFLATVTPTILAWLSVSSPLSSLKLTTFLCFPNDLTKLDGFNSLEALRQFFKFSGACLGLRSMSFHGL